MLNSKSKMLAAGWSEMFLREASYFVTLTFNWKGIIRPSAAVSSLKDFSLQLDAGRLGGRFYTFGPPDRTLFLLVPEKFDSYPHYHGLMMRPDDRRATKPAMNFPLFAAECWRRVVPGGTFDCQDLRNGGALDYATKETKLTSDAAVCSLEFWSPLSGA